MFHSCLLNKFGIFLLLSGVKLDVLGVPVIHILTQHLNYSCDSFIPESLFFLVIWMKHLTFK